MLRRGLERLEYARSATLRAENPHELARCLEVLSIMDSAELVLRASIERKESRPSHDFRRTEYPEQDNANWLAFLAARRTPSGEFIFTKIPIDSHG
jgi:succinate dehydrogenase/fumarate reductase flavoprotein subunit